MNRDDLISLLEDLHRDNRDENGFEVHLDSAFHSLFDMLRQVDVDSGEEDGIDTEVVKDYIKHVMIHMADMRRCYHKLKDRIWRKRNELHFQRAHDAENTPPAYNQSNDGNAIER